MSVAVWYEQNRQNIHERTEVIKRDAVASEISELMRHNRERLGRRFLNGIKMI